MPEDVHSYSFRELLQLRGGRDDSLSEAVCVGVRVGVCVVDASLTFSWLKCERVGKASMYFHGSGA